METVSTENKINDQDTKFRQFRHAEQLQDLQKRLHVYKSDATGLGFDRSKFDDLFGPS